MNTQIAQQSWMTFESHAKTFRLAAYLLPADCRDEVAEIYAFCRMLDDLADKTGDRRELEQIRLELLEEITPRPLVKRWLEIAKKRNIPKKSALDLLNGVISDLGQVEIADDQALIYYCYQVAGTVGVMMCGLLEVKDKSALSFAVDLGIAMQLTNIARDVKEDSEMGRIYLPKTRFKGKYADPEVIIEITRDILEMADRYYESADRGMRYLPAQARLAIWVAARMYQGIGKKLLRTGGNPMLGRTILSPLEKFFWGLQGLRAWLFGAKAQKHDRHLHRHLQEVSCLIG